MQSQIIFIFPLFNQLIQVDPLYYRILHVQMQPTAELYKDLGGEILSALNCEDVFPCHYSLNNTV